MSARLRIGTRSSPLALAQTELAVRALRRGRAPLAVEIVPLQTSGDRTRRAHRELDFTDEITRRLKDGTVDLGVHSAKDLPARSGRSTYVAAYLPRSDPRDCVILRRRGTLQRLPRGARIGSSSLRRRAQLLALRPDFEVVPIRGNVGTRLERMGTDGLDGLVLAAAGLRRLGWARRISQYLPTTTWLPAPGQGAIAIEIRRGDGSLRSKLAAIDHRPTRTAVDSERAVIRTLGGDCDLPLGAFAKRRTARRLQLQAALFSSDGRWRLTAQGSGPPARAERIGAEVGHALLAFGDPERLVRSGSATGP